VVCSEDSGLLNVSLTRARLGLVIVGNSTVLSEGSEDFLELTRSLEERRCVVAEEAFRAA